MFPPSRRGFHDLQGNVWEWLEDHFNMFPAADTDFLYNDYSTSSCDGRHGMMVVSSLGKHTLDIFRSPIEIQWSSWKYHG